MHIGFFGLNGWEDKIIKENFPQDEVFLSQDKINETNLPKKNDFEILSVFVDSTMSKKVLSHFPNLKFITTRSTGFDHIELKAAKSKNIAVSYVPGYGDNTVAEFAFGLILSLVRKIYQSIDQIKERGTFDLKNLRGMDIKDKTIGIIGTGRIGREMIKIAKGFSMNIIAYDPYPNENFAKEIGFAYFSFENVLRKSDIISLHCSYTPKTHHIINKDNIHLIKRGAYLINTARGALVETEALVSALQKNMLAGAGLDVLEEEGEIKDELDLLVNHHPKAEELKVMLYDHILMEMPNVLITPHNAFNSQEALERILDTTIENIKGFKSGSLVNLIPGK